MMMMMRVSHTHDVIGSFLCFRHSFSFCFTVYRFTLVQVLFENSLHMSSTSSRSICIFFWYVIPTNTATEISCGACWVGGWAEVPAWWIQILWYPFWRMSCRSHPWGHSSMARSLLMFYGCTATGAIMFCRNLLCIWMLVWTFIGLCLVIFGSEVCSTGDCFWFLPPNVF